MEEIYALADRVSVIRDGVKKVQNPEVQEFRMTIPIKGGAFLLFICQSYKKSILNSCNS